MKSLMENRENRAAILTLIEELEKMVGFKLKTPKHFEMMRSTVFNRTGELLSTTTLKRIWGYLEEPLNTRESTLSILARSLGYADWDSFNKNISEHNDGFTPSSPFLGRRINVMTDMKVGDLLSIYWQPDRKCLVKLIDECRFEVIQSFGTRLSPGDTFYCHMIMAGYPLYLSQLKQGNSTPVGYVCGQGPGGVQYEILASEE